jgi:hypothetical protein
VVITSLSASLSHISVYIRMIKQNIGKCPDMVGGNRVKIG